MAMRFIVNVNSTDPDVFKKVMDAINEGTDGLREFDPHATASLSVSYEGMVFDKKVHVP